MLQEKLRKFLFLKCILQKTFISVCKLCFTVLVHGHWDSCGQCVQGSHLREKTAFFTQKKSRLRKSKNAVRLLYTKKQ